KVNAGAMQLYRFWPETQTIEPLAALPSPFLIEPAVRAVPGGREVVFFGRPKDSDGTLDHLYALDLTSGHTRRLAPAVMFPQTRSSFPLAVTRDGEVLFDLPSGDLHHVVAAHVDGSTGLRSVLTLTGESYYMDVGPDGSLYLEQLDYPTEVLRFS